MILLHPFNDSVIFVCHHIGSVFCHWVIGLLSGGMLSGFCTLMWWRLMNTYSFGMRIWMWNTLMPRSTSDSNTLFLNLNSQSLSCIYTSSMTGKWFITVFMKCARCNRLFHLFTLHRWVQVCQMWRISQQSDVYYRHFSKLICHGLGADMWSWLRNTALRSHNQGLSQIRVWPGKWRSAAVTVKSTSKHIFYSFLAI